MQTFVLIGHCGPDASLLRNAIKRAVPGSAIVTADDLDALERVLHPGSVLLVNRVLDTRSLGTADGVELIRRLRATKAPLAAMLISNFPEAQRSAQDAGALQGFGKRDVNTPLAAECLMAAAKTAEKMLTHSLREGD